MSILQFLILHEIPSQEGVQWGEWTNSPPTVFISLGILIVRPLMVSMLKRNYKAMWKKI